MGQMGHCRGPVIMTPLAYAVWGAQSSIDWHGSKVVLGECLDTSANRPTGMRGSGLSTSVWLPALHAQGARKTHRTPLLALALTARTGLSLEKAGAD